MQFQLNTANLALLLPPFARKVELRVRQSGEQGLNELAAYVVFSSSTFSSFLFLFPTGNESHQVAAALQSRVFVSAPFLVVDSFVAAVGFVFKASNPQRVESPEVFNTVI